ncbi:hypothetical protein AKO1_005913 [Acrasis kona]|uniref:Uncharacterized protein n=1 Tax=Acrasis kona TaxID=1008807 RepID=A0AAW2YJW8_9EUKA
MTTPFVLVLSLLLRKTSDLIMSDDAIVIPSNVTVISVSGPNSPSPTTVPFISGDEHFVPVEKPSEGLFTILKNFGNKALDSVDDLVDKIVDYIQASLLKFSVQGIIIVLVTTLGYFGVLAAIVYLIPFAMSFAREVDQWIVGGAGVTLYCALLCYLFFYVRIEKYRDGSLKQWRIGLVKLLLLVCLTILVATAAASLCVLINLYIPKENDWYMRTIVVDCYLAFHTFVLVVLTAVLALEFTKKEKKEEEKDKVKESSRVGKFLAKVGDKLKQEKWFPWWFVFIDYLLIFGFAGAVSFVIVLYGIKFHDIGGLESQDVRWLMGSSISVGSDSVVSNPAMFFVKTVIYACLIQLTRGMLFPTTKPKKEEEKKDDLEVKVDREKMIYHAVNLDYGRQEDYASRQYY